VLGQALSEPAAPGVDLHEERLGLLAALQLDEVVATAQRAQLADTAVRAARRQLPAILDWDAVALRLRAVDALPVRRHVVVGAAADEPFEFRTVDSGETANATLTDTHVHALHHGPVEGKAALLGGRLSGDARTQRHHAAADVESNRPERDGSLVGISDDGASNRHA